jgi:hypothetical protein
MFLCTGLAHFFTVTLTFEGGGGGGVKKLREGFLLAKFHEELLIGCKARFDNKGQHFSTWLANLLK